MNELRKKRLESFLQREIAALFVSGSLKDPRLNTLITVVRVVLKSDMSKAEIYVSVYGNRANKNKVASALSSARGFIQHEVTKDMRIKNVPQFVFKIDNSLEEGDDVLEQLEKLSSESSLNEE